MAFRHPMGQPLQFPVGCARNSPVHPSTSFRVEDGQGPSQPGGLGESCASYEGNGRLIWSSFASLYGKWCDDKGTFAPPRPYKAMSKSKDDASNHKSGGQLSGSAAMRKQREGVVPRMKRKGSKDSLNGGSKLHVDTELSNGRRTPQEHPEEANRPETSLEEMLGVGGGCPSGSSDDSPTAPSSDGEGLAPKGQAQADSRGRRGARQSPPQDARRAQGGGASKEGLLPASALNEGRERDAAWADMMYQDLMDASGRDAAAQQDAPPAPPAASQEPAWNQPQRERLARRLGDPGDSGVPERAGLESPALAQMEQAADAPPPQRPCGPKGTCPLRGAEGRAEAQSTAAPSSQVDTAGAPSAAGTAGAAAAATLSGLPFFFGRTAAPKGSAVTETSPAKRPRPSNPLPFPWNPSASAPVDDEDGGRRKARRADDNPMPFLWVPDSATCAGVADTAEGGGEHEEHKPRVAEETKQEHPAEQGTMNTESAAGTQPDGSEAGQQAGGGVPMEAETVAGAEGPEAGNASARQGRPRRRGPGGMASSKSAKKAAAPAVDPAVAQAEDLLLKYVLEGRGKDVAELHEGRWCVNEAFVSKMAELFAAKRNAAGVNKDEPDGAEDAGAPAHEGQSQPGGQPQAGEQEANAAGSAGAAKRGAPMACPSDSSGSEGEGGGGQARSRGSGGSASGSLNSGMGQWEKMSCSVRTATHHLLELQRWDKSTRSGAVLWAAWLLRHTRKLPALRVPRPLSLLLFTSLHCALPRVLASLSDASFIAYGQDEGLLTDAKKLIDSVAKSKTLFTPLRWGMLAELLAKCRAMLQRKDSPKGPSSSAGTRRPPTSAREHPSARAAAAGTAGAFPAAPGSAAAAGGSPMDRKGKKPVDPDVPVGPSIPCPQQVYCKADAKFQSRSVPMETDMSPSGGARGRATGEAKADGASNHGKPSWKDGSGPVDLNEGQPGGHPGAAEGTGGISAVQRAAASADPLTMPPQRFAGRTTGQSQGFAFTRGSSGGSVRARGFGLGFAMGPGGCFGGAKEQGRVEGPEKVNEHGQGAAAQGPLFGASDTDTAAQDVAAKLAGLFSPFPCSARGAGKPKPSGGWGFRPSTNVAPPPKPPPSTARAPAGAGAGGTGAFQPESPPLNAAPAGTGIPRIFRAVPEEPQSTSAEQVHMGPGKPGLPRWSAFGMPRPGSGPRPSAPGAGPGEGSGGRKTGEENGAVPVRSDLPGMRFGARGQGGERKRDWNQAFNAGQARAAVQGEAESSIDNSTFTRLMMSFKPYGAPKPPPSRSRFGAPVRGCRNMELPVGSK